MYKKQVRGLIGITLTSAVAFGIVFGIKGVQNTEETYHGIQIDGHVEAIGNLSNETIQSAGKIVDNNGNLTGYILTVKEEGYGGEMLVDVAVTADGNKIIGVHVGDNKETQGIGTAITEAKFLDQFKDMETPVLMDGVTPTGTDTTETNNDIASMNLKDGTYLAKAKEADDNGLIEQVEITVKDGKVTSVIWDCIGEDGTTKRKLADEGKYVMTENGPTWTEQANALAETIIQKQSVSALEMNEEGKTDAVTGVSIYIGGFVNLLEECLSQADQSQAIVLKDGEYVAKASEADDNGLTEQVNMTVKDGKITAITWDCVGEDGTTKRKLVDEGKYVMTEDGLTWTEQADALAKKVIENQTVSAVEMNDQGKTDAVAGVSIYIGGFVGLVEDCLEQAGGATDTTTTTEAQEETADASTGTKIDGISGATISSKAVVRAIDKAVAAVVGMQE